MKFKINYKEGTWFSVPLRQGGYGVGIVARAKRTRVLAYFFGPRRESVPKLDDVSMLKANSAVAVLMIGDLGLVNGKWPIVGEAPSSWKREDWPMPVFVRREPISLRNWLVYYSDTDPNQIIKEVREPNERPELLEDSLYGCGAAEIKLTKLLCEGEQPSQSELNSVTTAKGDLQFSAMEGSSFRVEVLQQLHSMGSDTNRPHNFDFFLYLPTEAAARAAAEKIREGGFNAEIKPNESSTNWLCRASKCLVPESAPLDEIDMAFQQIALAFQGEFDGWESDVVTTR